MTIRSIAEAGVLLELARSLTPLQRQLLVNLHERGPGLPLEVAMRMLKFPEEISESVADLRAKGLIRAEVFSGSQYGSELLSLSVRGEQMVNLLRDPVVQQEFAQSQPVATAAQAAPPPSDPRQQELDLLKTLADLAVKQGNLTQASDYYKQALELTRQLAASA